MVGVLLVGNAQAGKDVVLLAVGKVFGEVDGMGLGPVRVETALIKQLTLHDRSGVIGSSATGDALPVTV